ncbi:MAG: hypothetical protein GY906_12875 [bacterium]|nr:hypothetical protein [bacterium]
MTTNLTANELLAISWRRLAGKNLPAAVDGLPFQQLVEETWSNQFETFMRNRLLMGCYRYGRFGPQQAAAYDMVPSMIKRLRSFQGDGNLEHLVDVANLCMLVFVHGESVGMEMIAQDDADHTELK